MKRVLLSVLVLGILVAGVVGYRYYRWIYSPNTPLGLNNAYVYIPAEHTVDGLVDSLVSHGYINNEKSFRWVAERMSFADRSVKAGRYLVEPGVSNRELINMFRLGSQVPIDLVVRPSLTVEVLSRRLGDQLMLDSADIANYINGPFMPQTGIERESLLSFFIPNTYEVWWNISADKLLERLRTEHERFWNEERRQKASDQGLTAEEVYTLASIVERETHIDSERPVIAGVYLNRLKRNIPLQADPTIQYANGDFGIRRVLYRHLEVDSPYNTYKNAGLPPGPIAMASRASIEAVLNPADHNYIFFCAKPGGGGHAFAETLSQHNRNAREYQRWLDSQGI